MNLEIKSIEKSETNSHLIEVLEWEEFKIETIKSKRAPAWAVFLPASISVGGKRVWSFTDHGGYSGLARMIDFGGQLVVYLATKTHLDQVMFVRHMPYMVKVSGSFFGGDIGEMVRAKERLADRFGLEPNWSKLELDYRRAVALEADVREEAERKAKEAERLAEVQKRQAEAQKREAERKAKEAERQARRARILARVRLVSFTEDGRRRIGVPVVGEEWMVLEHDSFCISVESFDDTTGVAGAMIESFKVQKRPGSVNRVAVATVTPENRKQSQVAAQPELGNEIVKIGDNFLVALVAPDMETVRHLNKNGLNSGTIVLVRDGIKQPTIFKLEGGEIKTMGVLKTA